MLEDTERTVSIKLTQKYPRAKYQPYDALRQQFWRQYLKQYDTDENGLVSHLEITSMLDSLGSTLSGATIDGFFTKHGKQPRVDELTYDEAIQCLEEELCRPQSEKKRLNTDDSAAPDTSTPATPMLLNSSSEENTPGMKELELENIDFSGPHVHPTAVHPASTVAHTFLDEARRVESIPLHLTEPSQQPLSHAANANTSPNPSAPEKLERQLSEYSEDGAEESSSSNSAGEDSFERVINVKNCPLCHKPRLNSRAEVDIVTHLAICASQDWARMDRIMVSNFVTASQAQRKWYTKVISKVSSGNYKLGAVCFIIMFVREPNLIFGVRLYLIEFGEHHRAESNDGSARGREDASLRSSRNKIIIQSASLANYSHVFLATLIAIIAYREPKAEWKVHEHAGFLNRYQSNKESNMTHLSQPMIYPRSFSSISSMSMNY